MRICTFVWIATILVLVTKSYASTPFPMKGVIPEKDKISTIVIGYHEDFPPYVSEEYSNKKKKVIGIFPEMVQLAAQKLGIAIQFQKFPWKRLLENAREKKVDAIMPLLKTPEREKFLFYPDTGIAIADVSFFSSPAKSIHYTGELVDLKSYTIGIVESYDYGNELYEAQYLTKEPCPSDETLVEKFKLGRLQVGLSDKRVIQYYARKANISEKQIQFIEPAFLRKPLHIAFSKKNGHQELAKKFSWALRQLRQEGKHLDILKKYHCEDDFAFFQELVIGIDQEPYPPYSYWQNGTVQGIGSDLIKKVAETMEIDFRFKKIIWQDYSLLAKQGQINAITPVFKTEERTKDFYFPQKGIIPERNYFFTLKTNTTIHYSGELNALQGVSIGALKDYSYGSDFDKAKNLTVTRFESFQLMMQQLLSHKINVIVGDKSVIKFFAEKVDAWEKLKTLGPSLPSEFLYLAFSKKNSSYQKVSQSFSDAIKAVMKNGYYRQILKNHGLENRAITLAADNWEPYYSEKITNYGPIAEIITEAFKRVDYEVSIDFMPRANMMDKVKLGKYLAGFAVAYSNELSKDFYYSELIDMNTPYLLYKRKDNTIIYNGQLSDLKPYRIGVVRGFLYGNPFDNSKSLNKIEAYSSEVNLRQLLDDRLDLMIIDQWHAQYLLNRIAQDQRSRLENFDLFPKEIGSIKKLYLLISKNTKEAEQIKVDFNFGLEQILKDGTINNILTRHGVKNGKSSKISQ